VRKKLKNILFIRPSKALAHYEIENTKKEGLPSYKTTYTQKSLVSDSTCD
jgi:hypothetical protein